jgi:hypothetical protein
MCFGDLCSIKLLYKNAFHADICFIELVDFVVPTPEEEKNQSIYD